MKIFELINEEDDPLGQFIQKKGLSSNSPADKFAAAIEQEDEISKIATGKLSPASLHSREPVPKATATPVPTSQVKPTQLPPAKPAQAQAPVKTAQAPTTAKPTSTPAPKVNIQQPAGSIPWKDIANYCRTKWNMSVEQVAGMLANVQAESGFIANKQWIDSNGLPAGGLFSHNGVRFQALTQALGNNWKQNWQGQVDFAMNEKEGRTYRASQYSSPTQASQAWTKIFERPRHANRQAVIRAPASTQYYSGMK